MIPLYIYFIIFQTIESAGDGKLALAAPVYQSRTRGDRLSNLMPHETLLLRLVRLSGDV